MDEADHALPPTFGRRLRQLRQRVGLTQRALAIAVGVTPSMIQRWERRGAMPAHARLSELAAVLGVPHHTLLGLSGQVGVDAPAPSGKASSARPRTLRELRAAAGLSQWELAVRLGVTEGAISRWEAGTRQPQTRYLADLARLLGNGSLDTILASLAAPPRPEPLPRAGPGTGRRPGAVEPLNPSPRPPGERRCG